MLDSFIDACYTKSYYKDRNDWLEKNGFMISFDDYDKEDLKYYEHKGYFNFLWREPKDGKRKIHH
jgi:hypothetical protein